MPETERDPAKDSALRSTGRQHALTAQQTRDRAEELRDENARLKESMRARAAIDQATGILIALAKLTPEQGQQVVHELAQHTGIKVRDVAQMLIDSARTRQLPRELRPELDRLLAAYRSPHDDV